MAKIDRKVLRETAYAEKSRVVITNMVYKDNPPPFISIVGPESSGKSTLLRSIVGHYWKNRGLLQGPVTMKVGHKRFTFYESTSAIENVVDTIKISDMIVLLINLEVGLQRETLETLTMINSQGVPKLCFVLTHHSECRPSKGSKEIAKRIQKEFSHPVRFFYMDKIDSENTYRADKLVRYLETMRYRPVEWKCTHPHIVVDKIRDGYIYGYTRGGPMNSRFDAHIPGHGDKSIDGVEVLEDPCSLGSRSNVFYNPMGSESMSDEQPSGNADSFEIDEPEIKLFDDDDAANFILDKIDERPTSLGRNREAETHRSPEAGTVCVESSASEKENDLCSEPSDLDRLDDLKSGVRGRFKRLADTEEELEERFNKEYKERGGTGLNFLCAEKKKQLETRDKLDQSLSLIIPGSYVRTRLDVGHAPTDVLIIGAYLPSENANIVLKGQVRKNKWQKTDLKSNAPFFFSMGWFRFQSIPLFTQANKALKYCKECSELMFYGPSVPVGTGFFMFSPDSHYRILGTGKVLDCSGELTVKKKLKLLGYPKTIVGNNVIVQSMFSTGEEADRFVNAKLSTASGLRGLLKSSVGRDGCFRSTFEGSLLMSDIIFLKCFVPVEPYSFIRHIRPDQCFARSLKSIREEMGLPLFEESVSEDVTECGIAEYADESRSRRETRSARELRALERELPFGQRTIREVRETVELPVPPEQRRIFERSEKTEDRRKLAEQTDEMLRKQELEARRKRNVETQKEKAERKKKNAVQGCLKKKKHRGGKKR